MRPAKGEATLFAERHSAGILTHASRNSKRTVEFEALDAHYANGPSSPLPVLRGTHTHAPLGLLPCSEMAKQVPKLFARRSHTYGGMHRKSSPFVTLLRCCWHVPIRRLLQGRVRTRFCRSAHPRSRKHRALLLHPLPPRPQIHRPSRVRDQEDCQSLVTVIATLGHHGVAPNPYKAPGCQGVNGRRTLPWGAWEASDPDGLSGRVRIGFSDESSDSIRIRGVLPARVEPCGAAGELLVKLPLHPHPHPL
jgi:hypothetical protein